MNLKLADKIAKIVLRCVFISIFFVKLRNKCKNKGVKPERIRWFERMSAKHKTGRASRAARTRLFWEFV